MPVQDTVTLATSRSTTSFGPRVAAIHPLWAIEGGRIVIEGSGDVVAAVIALLVQERVVPEQTRVEQSTLDDAFVALTSEADAELAGAQATEPG